ncbi:MAG TPA: GGDEF domain-containing protein [Chromobacteriaceae bacterium]|nr:GGDEF domain-containing protein [Chromobacteriaceae bacterium]
MQSLLDIRATLLCTSGYSLMLTVIILLFWRKSRGDKPLLALGIVGILSSLAGMIYLLPTPLGFWHQLVLANLLFLAASLHMLIATEHFTRQPRSWWLYGLILLVELLLLSQDYILLHTNLRISIIMAGYVLIWLWGSWRIWQVRHASARDSYRPLLLLALLQVAIPLLRIPLIWPVPQAMTPAQASLQGLLSLSMFWTSYGYCLFIVYRRYAGAVDKLAEQAQRDSLTGLYNQRAFRRLAERSVHEAQTGQQPLAVLMLDLDHFKSINDQHGHLYGDEVLMAVADCLRQHVRPQDVVGRHGGEEFIILLRDTPTDTARHIAERLRAAVEALMLHNEHVVTVSIGLAMLATEATSLTQLIKQADDYLYQAKHQGRNRVVAMPAG